MSKEQLEARVRELEQRLSTREDEVEREALGKFVQASLDACYLMRAVRGPDGRIEDFVFEDLNAQAEIQLGQPREVIVGARLCELHPFHRETGLLADYARVVEEGESLRRELEVPGLPTGTRWYLQHVVPTRRGILLKTRDITRDKASERVRSELELRAQQTQNMESLGMLAGGVAHDFNNLLLAIGGFAELASYQVQDEPERAAGSLQHIIEATRRAADLTRQLLVLSNRRSNALEHHELSALVARNMGLVKQLMPQRVELKLELADTPLHVYCTESHLVQVLLNLCLNARDAMPDGGTITLRTSAVTLAAGSEELNPGESPGDVARLQVADTGVGMDDDTMRQVFEPFFTTKDVGKGTGLGLALVYSIVHQHQGSVRVQSTLGEGTTFTIDLRRAEPGQQVVQTPVLSPPEQGSETVLVVDDESAVRVLVGAALERAGYRVRVAGSGREALEVFQRDPSAIDLVILDVVMPGMDGKQTYDALRKLRPDLRVLFSTGFERDVFPPSFFNEGKHPLLRKPYEVRTLLRATRAVLDGEG